MLDGKVPHAVLLELLTDHGTGTPMTSKLAAVLVCAPADIPTADTSAADFAPDQATASRPISRAVVNT